MDTRGEKLPTVKKKNPTYPETDERTREEEEEDRGRQTNRGRSVNKNAKNSNRRRRDVLPNVEIYIHARRVHL